jgi:hypothetical protein
VLIVMSQGYPKYRPVAHIAIQDRRQQPAVWVAGALMKY